LGPGGRVNVEEGAKVCSRWQALNKRVVNVIEPKQNDASQQLPLLDADATPQEDSKE
jgi:hypothetical protein